MDTNNMNQLSYNANMNVGQPDAVAYPPSPIYRFSPSVSPNIVPARNPNPPPQTNRPSMSSQVSSPLQPLLYTNPLAQHKCPPQEAALLKDLVIRYRLSFDPRRDPHNAKKLHKIAMDFYSLPENAPDTTAYVMSLGPKIYEVMSQMAQNGQSIMSPNEQHTPIATPPLPHHPTFQTFSSNRTSNEKPVTQVAVQEVLSDSDEAIAIWRKADEATQQEIFLGQLKHVKNPTWMFNTMTDLLAAYVKSTKAVDNPDPKTMSANHPRPAPRETEPTSELRSPLPNMPLKDSFSKPMRTQVLADACPFPSPSVSPTNPASGLPRNRTKPNVANTSHPPRYRITSHPKLVEMAKNREATESDQDELALLPRHRVIKQQNVPKEATSKTASSSSEPDISLKERIAARKLELMEQKSREKKQEEEENRDQERERERKRKRERRM